jgi:choline dehydrogenase-like flavoprotein
VVGICAFLRAEDSKGERWMQDFDYIIIGAGVAGSVIAARLSETADKRVALIEAGDENPMDIGRSQGAFFLTWGSDKNWAYATVPQAGLGGRSIDHPRGRAIGGSNVLNVGAWLRGRPEDYDAWEAAGAAGWNGTAALDAFLAVERTDRSPLRGHDGPLAMTDLPTPTDLSERLRDAFVETGLGKRGDSAGPDPFVVDRFQTLFVDGVRRTVADAFLTDEVQARENLTIVTGAHVTRILIEDDRATGVEVRTSDGARTIAARREVVLSAGTFNSPQLLMLSGIGPRDHLSSLGIDTVLDAPAVGENLQDHIYAHVYTLAAAGTGGSVPPGLAEADIARWLASHDGPSSYFTENGVGWATRDGKAVPDYELLLSYNTAPGNFGEVADADGRSGTTIGVVLLQPKSRGTVRLTSSDPLAKPVIDPRYLSEGADVASLVAGLRIAQRLAQADVLKPWAETIFPAVDASDETLAAFIPGDIGTVFHPVGTVRMGAADDPAAVVDERLRVKGIAGLRVADASVMPALIRGHTMAPTVFIGHRAADLIAADEA